MNVFKIEVARKIHGDIYDYSKIVYKNARTNVEIICPMHGSFWQSYESHTYRKNGCPKCKGTRLRNEKQFSFQQWIDKSTAVHGDRYEYPQQVINNAHDVVNIICKLHGPYLQNFNNHVFGKNGCPSCGYNVSKLEQDWLDSLNIQHLERQKILSVGCKKYKVDAFDPVTNTVYEFFGVFWHGHPDYFTGINPRTGKLFCDDYNATLQKISNLKAAGYNLIEKWG